MKKAMGIFAGTVCVWFLLAVFSFGQETMPGDLDKSGTINAADLVILQQYLAGSLGHIPAEAGALVDVDPIVGNLRWVPGGTFRQGALEGDPCGAANYFEHTLTADLAVMETEVSRQMWADLLSLQPTLPADPSSLTYSPGMRHPVLHVTWYQAVFFANLLSRQYGLRRCYYTNPALDEVLDSIDPLPTAVYCDWEASGYRLPTEGEWEYFCRAGTTTPFSISEPAFTTCDATCASGVYLALEQAAWFCGNSGPTPAEAIAHPVGWKLPNPWGLKDVHGNVWEWCWDRAGAYPTVSQTDYRGLSTGTSRVTRGGSFSYFTMYCRSACRGSIGETSYSNSLGFRLVRRASIHQ